MIVIDPGHGGPDPGAVGPAGTRESDINLTLGFYLQEALGGAPYMTRTSDVAISLGQRAAMFPMAKAFISLHCNSYSHPGPQGFEIYTSPGDTGADILASHIFKSVINASSPQRRFRSDWSDSDEDKEARFFVLVNTLCPAVLIEVAFLSNPMEEQMLRDDLFLRLQACAIARGIERWQG